LASARTAEAAFALTASRIFWQSGVLLVQTVPTYLEGDIPRGQNLSSKGAGVGVQTMQTDLQEKRKKNPKPTKKSPIKSDWIGWLQVSPLELNQ
jgi:hypothetical protein